MSDQEDNVDRIIELAGAVCDETASADDCDELDAIVVAGGVSRRDYWDYCWVHVTLGDGSAGASGAAKDAGAGRRLRGELESVGIGRVAGGRAGRSSVDYVPERRFWRHFQSALRKLAGCLSGGDRGLCRRAHDRRDGARVGAGQDGS